ncbi:MAG TPA: helix-turn-helix transcriptional regulator [Ktedonobacteraceae bacterium]|nr:helix-turn-helix transcriptional regulator [Ktedonobacteraceae bacterium]
MSKTYPTGATTAVKLRIAREQAGLSQGQVAKMLHLHRPSISEIEAGRRKVSTDELAEFARIYGVSVSWLVNTDTGKENANQYRIELAARELAKLKQEDLDRVLQLLSAMRTEESTNT